MFNLVIDEEYRQDVYESGYEFFTNRRDKCFHVMIPDLPDDLLELPIDQLAEFFGFQPESIIAGELS